MSEKTPEIALAQEALANHDDERMADGLRWSLGEVERLRAENKKFRAFIEGIQEFEPRTDYYANELKGEAHEVLGRCRCCGETECEETTDE